MQNEEVTIKKKLRISGVISQHSHIWLQGKLIQAKLMGQLKRNYLQIHTGWKSCSVEIKGLGNLTRSLTDVDSNIHNCIIKVY